MACSLIVHGGAWAIPDDEVEAHKAGCRAARDAGWAVLMDGGTAMDAVQAAVQVLEDDPTFDAGIGSVLNSDGFVELDAAVMDGETLRSGAVAAVRSYQHPIALARSVMASDVILMVGEGAERFAASRGFERCDPAIFVVERERLRHATLLQQRHITTPDAFRGTQQPGDTVGCVALDSYGNLAAGTSTGGTPNKPPGRVGDSPLIGCGLYADNASGGCSTTGWGESIIKVVLAKTATDAIGAGRDPMAAAQHAIDTLAKRVNGLGGCILLDGQGRVGLAFNTPRMAYAYRTGGGSEDVGV